MEDLIDILPLVGTVVYPQTVTPLAVAHPDSLRLLAGDDGAPRRIGVIALRGTARPQGALRPADCFPTGCVALVHRLLRLPDGSLRVAVEGLERFTLLDLTGRPERQRAAVRALPDPPPADADALRPQLTRLRAYVEDLARRPPGVSQDLLAEIDAEEDPRRLCYLLAGPILARAPLAERQALLDLPSLEQRLALLSAAVVDLPAPPAPPPAAPPPRLDPGRALWLRRGADGMGLAVVEAAALPGEPELILTGQAGRLARDAALIARTWLLGSAARLGVAPPAGGLHLHTPPGAARDERAGASAPIALALLGLLRGQGQRADTALIGELGLYGHLLPLGRLRERVEAACDTGLTALAIAAGHAEELGALPTELTGQLRIALVERLDEALDLLF